MQTKTKPKFAKVQYPQLKPWVMDGPFPIPGRKLGVFYQIVGKASVQVFVLKSPGRLSANELKETLNRAWERTKKLKKQNIYDKLTITVEPKKLGKKAWTSGDAWQMKYESEFDGNKYVCSLTVTNTKDGVAEIRSSQIKGSSLGKAPSVEALLKMLDAVYAGRSKPAD